MFPRRSRTTRLIRSNLNTAASEQLKALPALSDAYSEQTIKGRPYQRKDELVQKKIEIGSKKWAPSTYYLRSGGV
jgi:DNA uptake protein ComE-like DNA-binding protein